MSGFWVLKDEQRRDNLIAYLRTLPVGKGLTVSINKPAKTPAQRAYWHNAVRILAKSEGKTEEWLKDELKMQWLPLREHIKRDGEVVYMPKRTEELSREDYSLLIEKTLALAAFLDVVIPEADHFGLETPTPYHPSSL